jgi:hypothetical protein
MLKANYSVQVEKNKEGPKRADRFPAKSDANPQSPTPQKQPTLPRAVVVERDPLRLTTSGGWGVEIGAAPNNG